MVAPSIKMGEQNPSKEQEEVSFSLMVILWLLIESHGHAPLKLGLLVWRVFRLPGSIVKT